jgi:hypothetical protein
VYIILSLQEGGVIDLHKGINHDGSIEEHILRQPGERGG